MNAFDMALVTIRKCGKC